MKINLFNMDERNINIIRSIQSVMYSITLLMLVVMIFRRAFVLDQSFEEFADLGLVIVFNGFFVLGSILYFGGITFQKFKLKYVLAAYFVFVFSGFIVKCLDKRIFTDTPLSYREILTQEMVVITVICTLFTAVFLFFAYFGKRRIDKDLD